MRAVLVLLVLVAAGSARVIVVPDSATTIQTGLGMAGSGDTVLVKPGTYQELLTWPGADGITLMSAAGPESTFVDGQNAGTCLQMNSGGLTRATVVTGFTFINGYHASGSAAGISCLGSASIIGNRVTRCRGAGIYVSSYSSGFNPLVMGNEVDGCVKEIENWNYGAGLYISAEAGSYPEICYNYIHHDTLRNSARNYGGGVYCDANALIYQNRIEANVLCSDTGSACRAYGAGIFVDMRQQPVIFSNLIIGNRCATDAWKYGAGIRSYLYARPVIISNTIADNVCEGPHMWSNGGGLYFDNSCTSYVKHNIVANNQATSGSGVYNNNNAQMTSRYNDYYNNTLVGCSPGPGDISSDPLFVTGAHGNYYLSQTASGQPATSPCVDAGETLDMKTPLNLDSLLRVWTTRTDSVADAAMLDMGFHYPRLYFTGVEQPPRAPELPAMNATLFRDRVALLTTLTGPAELLVFDINGRIVHRASGAGRFEWSAEETPLGVYVWRIAAAGGTESGRLLKAD